MENISVYQGIRILYCDNHVLVAEKPARMPSQADSSKDPDMLTLLKAYIKERYQKPGAVYLGLVHRLDRPVGGLMVFARTSKAAARLSQQVREHTFEKDYLAVVEGEAQDAAEVFSVLSYPDKEQQARLSYTCLARKEGLSLLKVRLETGRKHQIRRQLLQEGLPIWGDMRYGKGRVGENIALYAFHLSIEHPTQKNRLTFTAMPAYTMPWRIFEQALKAQEKKIGEGAPLL